MRSVLVPVLSCTAVALGAQKPIGATEELPHVLNSREVVEAIERAYPRELLRARQGGAVVLSMIVGVDSVPTEVRVHQSSGHPALDSVAAVSARRFRFKPAAVNGRPVRVRITVPLTFRPPRRRWLGIF